MQAKYYFTVQKTGCLFVLICFLSFSARAWQTGYNFRKKITLTKSFFSASADLANFKFLLLLQDDAIRFLPGNCQFNRVSGYSMPDICFATATVPETILHAQVDQYDAGTGKLICWVGLPLLSVSSTPTSATEIYLYYGSNTLQDSYSKHSVDLWDGSTGVWHMNSNANPSTIRNSASTDPSDLAEIMPQNSLVFQQGKIGTSIHFDGMSQRMLAKADTSTGFNIASWIRLDRHTTEQVLVSNRTADGGYELVVLPTGNLQIQIYNYGFRYDLTSTSPLINNQWYHVNAAFRQKTLTLFVNGIPQGAVGQTNLKMAPGNMINIGATAVGTKYLMGAMDELQIQPLGKTSDQVQAAYANQNNPAACYTLGIEEAATIQQPTGALFTGSVNENWMEPGNWNIQSFPPPNANIIVATNATVSVPAAVASINQLHLEQGATISLAANLEVKCTTTLKNGASVKIAAGAVLQCDADIFNDGLISATNGTLILAGEKTSSVSGTGNIRVAQLSVNMNNAVLNTALLQPVYISKLLTTDRGGVITNRNLTLGLNDQKETAEYSPAANFSPSGIVGDVIVEYYISGGFSYPGNARGWRLLTSPVYQEMSVGHPVFQLAELKNDMFITGIGGSSNGFDNAPLNGNTIYIHRPELGGTLSEKYEAVAQLSQHIPLGEGYFLFSRGSRLLPDAYRQEVLSPPFINPEGFTIRYLGAVWMGISVKSLVNVNRGGEGDGFNLLGNPYPFAIRWGSLGKTNLSPYIWFYDAVNQSYTVTDNPETKIPPGTGFFVKVNPTASSGTLTLDPAARYSINKLTANSAVPNTLAVTLSNADISQNYSLQLKDGASDSANPEDAEKIGSGILSIASLSPESRKLSVDKRSLSAAKKQIRLFVQGQLSGDYSLNFSGFNTFRNAVRITLEDRYLAQKIPFSGQHYNYTFHIDKKDPGTEGDNRFALYIEGASEAGPEDNLVTVYPNPFTNTVYVKAGSGLPENISLKVRDVMGNLVLSKTWIKPIKTDVLSISGTGLSKGIYFLELVNAETNLPFKFAKIIKQ
ncbi:MAG: T9SS type A sorting domain-containing protein [Pedobacter sp.]|nr:MAG: T9SS type A sorting domain-containing protein [Pedobacter sp.]